MKKNILVNLNGNYSGVVRFQGEGALQKFPNGLQHVSILLLHRLDECEENGVSLCTAPATEAAGEFRMELGIADRPLGAVVVGRNIRIVEKGEDLFSMPS